MTQSPTPTNADAGGAADLPIRVGAVLVAISHLREPYGNTILAQVNRKVRPNWLTRMFPSLEALQGMSVGRMYVCLDALERAGLVSSEWSSDTFAERGDRRRRYYNLTDLGRTAVRMLNHDTL